MNIYEFVPQFRTDVVVSIRPYPPTYPNGASWPINPRLCATDQTTEDLKEIFADLKPEIVQASATGIMYGPFTTPLVNALQFTAPDKTKAVVLAGILAGYFISFGPVNGENMCRREISGALQDARAQEV
jgi:hypothetical protein